MESPYGYFFKLGSLWGVLFVRVPYYMGDQKPDPNLENYPYEYTMIEPITLSSKLNSN